MTIDAIVTNVSVVMFIVGIHLTEMIIRIDIPVVLTLLSIWTSSAIGGAKRPTGSEHFKRILSIYFHRVCIEEPVEHIKMVSVFMNPECSASFALTVPPLHIRSLVSVVDIPMKIDRSDIPNGTFHQ